MTWVCSWLVSRLSAGPGFFSFLSFMIISFFCVFFFLLFCKVVLGGVEPMVMAWVCPWWVCHSLVWHFFSVFFFYYLSSFLFSYRKSRSRWLQTHAGDMALFVFQILVCTFPLSPPLFLLFLVFFKPTLVPWVCSCLISHLFSVRFSFHFNYFSFFIISRSRQWHGFAHVESLLSSVFISLFHFLPSLFFFFSFFFSTIFHSLSRSRLLQKLTLMTWLCPVVNLLSFS